MGTIARRILGAALAVVLVGAAVIGARLAFAEDPVELEAMFGSTVGLYPGSDVQVLGVPVGTVTAVEPEGDAVRVSMEIDSGQDVAADTKAVIVAPTLVSDRFVQLQPHEDGEALESGTVIDVEETAVPVEIDQLYESLIDVGEQLGPEGANRDGALSELLTVAAENLDGQGEDLNTMIREFGKATGTMADFDEEFFATIGNLEEFNSMLLANDRQVARVNRQFASVSEYLAKDRHDLERAVTNLGQAMEILDDFIRENRDNLRTSVDQLMPATRVLVEQQEALEESVRTAPLVLQNFMQAYNGRTNTLDGRGNLNELTIWSDNGLTGRTSADAPPTMDLGAGEDR